MDCFTWKYRWFGKVSRASGGDSSNIVSHGLYPEAYFRRKIVEERRRAERSNKPLIVMVLDTRRLPEGVKRSGSVGERISSCVRDTDICGVLDDGPLIGVILTEVEPGKEELTKRKVAGKAREALGAALGEQMATLVAISFKTYPGSGDGAFDMTFYPDITEREGRKLGGDILKRALDVVGSIVGLILFSPFFVVLPVLIKATSRGPVFFRQERIGRNGRKFKFLKFRSMYLDNDDIIHREYVQKLIKGGIRGEGNGEAVYKIQGDPRVTPLGRFIRKYSLDELPQFINVLKGDMSLVGPRPPISYEVEHYCGWQRNRLIGKKPGITGLWQVKGRSSTTFDEMVRLDLGYLRKWTILQDLKILLQTPGAVLKGRGAY